jgi:hypothetical protein
VEDSVKEEAPEDGKVEEEPAPEKPAGGGGFMEQIRAEMEKMKQEDAAVAAKVRGWVFER